VREIGVVEAQFMDSILPFASFPQAVACAARAAARSEVADAFAQLRRPRNSTQTSHRYCCAASVDQSRNPTRSAASASQSHFMAPTKLHHEAA